MIDIVASLDGVAVPVRRFWRWLQLVLLLLGSGLIALCLLNPDALRTQFPSKINATIAVLVLMNANIRVVIFLILEIWVAHAIIFRLIRQRFCRDRMIFCQGTMVGGFDRWGRLTYVPLSEIASCKIDANTLKITHCGRTIQIPIDGFILTEYQKIKPIEMIEEAVARWRVLE